MSPLEVATLLEKLGKLDGQLEGTTTSLNRLDRNLEATQGMIHRHGTSLELNTNALDDHKLACRQHMAEVDGRIKKLSERVNTIDGRVEETGRIYVVDNARAAERRELKAKAKEWALFAGKVLAGAVAASGVIIGMAAALGLLSGCTVANVGGFAIGQAEKYTLNTKAKCIHGAELAQLSDQYLPVILREAEREGLVSYFSAVEKLRGKVMVCGIPTPEPCCMNVTCAGPHKGGLSARKAGCTVWTSVWVSETWPPVCTSEWPDEPHCGEASDYDWKTTLIHELHHVVGLNVIGNQDPAHTSPLFTVVEPRVQARLKNLTP